MDDVVTVGVRPFEVLSTSPELLGYLAIATICDGVAVSRSTCDGRSLLRLKDAPSSLKSQESGGDGAMIG